MIVWPFIPKTLNCGPGSRNACPWLDRGKAHNNLGQLLGRMGDEALLLQLAAQVEQAAPWFDRLSPLARLEAASPAPH